MLEGDDMSQVMSSYTAYAQVDGLQECVGILPASGMWKPKKYHGSYFLVS